MAEISIVNIISFFLIFFIGLPHGSFDGAVASLVGFRNKIQFVKFIFDQSSSTIDLTNADDKISYDKYIDDLIDAMVLVMGSQDLSCPINVGNPLEISIQIVCFYKTLNLQISFSIIFRKLFALFSE